MGAIARGDVDCAAVTAAQVVGGRWPVVGGGWLRRRGCWFVATFPVALASRCLVLAAQGRLEGENAAPFVHCPALSGPGAKRQTELVPALVPFWGA